MDVANQGAYPLQVYYTVNGMDERGNVIDALQGTITTQRHVDPATGRLKTVRATDALGNDVQDLEYFWDDLGNLDHRWDYRRSLTEDFEYDGLNRLTSSQVGGQPIQEVRYNSVGNITFKSGVGDYYYDDSDCTTDYGPHAVCHTSDGVDYHYDANGNMTSDSSGRTLSYTTFDKARSISKGGHTTTFDYGPDRARYKRVDTDQEGKVTTTLYIGNVEKISRPGGSYTVKRYIAGVAIETLDYSSSGSQTPQSRSTQYLHKDHLGSMDVITSRYGEILQEMSFDPWGQRRNVLDWDSLDVASLLNFDHSITTRGYTGHEMLDEVGLIHMNGRVYDPRLGRFVQADPFIDGVTSTQGYNRYSYVHNNPLAATDPSGYSSRNFFTALKIIVAAVLTVACDGVCGPQVWAWAMGTTSAVEAAANGGNFGQIATAAFTGAVMGYFGASLGAGGFTGTEAFQFGVLGGITSVLQGGKFGHGFISAYVGSSVNASGILQGAHRAVQFIANVVVGGTVSKATGGKFANGAAYAAFAFAVRAVASEISSASGVNSSTGTNTSGEDPQQRIDRLVAEVYEDHPNLEKIEALTVTATEGVGIDGDPDVHGEWTSQNSIRIAYEGRSDNFIKGIIFHEFAHVDEAMRTTWGNIHLWQAREFWFDGGHDTWTRNAGDAYTEWLRVRQRAPELLHHFNKPNIDNAPWRR